MIWNIKLLALCFVLVMEGIAMASNEVVPSGDLDKLNKMLEARSAIVHSVEDPDTGKIDCAQAIGAAGFSADTLSIMKAKTARYRAAKQVFLDSHFVAEMMRATLKHPTHGKFIFPLVESLKPVQLDGFIDVLVDYGCRYGHRWQEKSVDLLATKVSRATIQGRLLQEIARVLKDEDSTENEWEMAIELVKRVAPALVPAVAQMPKPKYFD